MSNKSLIIGDLHIGKGMQIGKPSIDGSLNSRIIDRINILNWLLELGINKSINRFIFCGDIFEEFKPDNNYIVIFMDWLKQCNEFGIDIHIIIGNHDIKRVGNRYSSVLNIIRSSELTNVNIYNSVYTLHTDGVSFTFLPFKDKRSLNCEHIDQAFDIIKNWLMFESLSIPINNDKVLIGHYAIEKSFWVDEVDDLTNELILSNNTFNNYNYVWMGHVHTPQVMKVKNPRIAHIGSVDISDFGETDEQKIVVLFDPSSKDKFEEIEVPTRPLRRIKLEIPKDKDPTDFLIKSIDNMSVISDFKNAIVKIELKLSQESIEVNRTQIKEKLYDMGIYHIASFSESRVINVISDEKKHISNSAIKPKEAVKQWANILDWDEVDMKEDFISRCIDIIETTDQKIKDKKSK